MTAKTSGEIEKEFIDGLKASTKKDLNGWLAEIRSLGITKRNDIINSLKNNYGFGHMNASLLAGIYLNEGKPVYASTDDLLENQFAKAEAMRGLYESVINFVKQNFPAATVYQRRLMFRFLKSANLRLSILNRRNCESGLISVTGLSMTLLPNPNSPDRCHGSHTW